MRHCWTGSIGPLLAETHALTGSLVDPDRAPLAFVPVGSLGQLSPAAEPAADPAAIAVARLASKDASGERDLTPSLGWTLWGDTFL